MVSSASIVAKGVTSSGRRLRPKLPPHRHTLARRKPNDRLCAQQGSVGYGASSNVFLHDRLSDAVGAAQLRCLWSTKTGNIGEGKTKSERCAAVKMSNMSPRQKASVEERILDALSSNAKDPVLHTDVRALGWIRGVIIPGPITRVPTALNGDLSTDGNKVVVSVRLPTLLHPSIAELKRVIVTTVEDEIGLVAAENGWDITAVDVDVDVQVSAAKPVPFVRNVEEQDELIKNLGPGLRNVGHYLAVYSCKGGVGKSTVAVNLAYELAKMGCRVGVLDVDIYGPSLPVLIKPDDLTVRRSPLGSGMVMPIEHRNVKIMSLGYVSPDSGVPGSGPTGGAAVMRGPMAGRVVTQLLKGTDWGELDVLVIDLPPGTGDVQLAICQDVQLSGAVSVTTPSKLAVTDARKGIEMFTSLGVPTLAAVENMAYFECEGGGKHYPFGRGMDDLSNTTEDLDFKTANIFQLPISSLTNMANDSGEPLCLARPDDAAKELAVFGQLASAISRELLLLQHGRSGDSDNQRLGSTVKVSVGNGSDSFDVAATHLSLDNVTQRFVVRFFSDSGATQVLITGEELRSRHPKTGENLSDENASEVAAPTHSRGGCSSDNDGIVQHHKQHNHKPKLFPAKIEKKGRYGYSVEWADGATIIYSMLSIAKAAGGESIAG